MVYVTRLVQESTRKKAAEKERLAASALLTWVVRRELPEWAGKDARELLVYGPHGKPYLKGNPFYFNLSHSGGIVACAVQTREVGLDVEKKREFSQRLKERICTPAEYLLVSSGSRENENLTQLWTMKESYMKYTGLGFAQGILSTEFRMLGKTPELCSGRANFVCAEFEDAFFTLCTAEPVPLEIMEVRFEDVLENLQ